MEGDMESIQNIFFDAMRRGWACDNCAKKIEVPQLPGSKAISFEHGPLRVVDCYMTNLNFSTGTTTIWYRGRPLWVMHYGGRYEKEAIPFLKFCLRRAYTERRFYGGRGPNFMRDDRFTYVNKIERNNFRDFAGEERIFDTSGQCFGYHWYRGMSL